MFFDFLSSNRLKLYFVFFGILCCTASFFCKNGQIFAARKAMVTQRSDGIRNCNVFKTCAVGKAVSAQGGDRIGNCDTFKICAAGEAMVAQKSDRIGNCDVFKTCAVGKAASAQRGDRPVIGDDAVFTPCNQRTAFNFN